jgi:hypothetical protein
MCSCFDESFKKTVDDGRNRPKTNRIGKIVKAIFSKVVRFGKLKYETFSIYVKIYFNIFQENINICPG